MWSRLTTPHPANSISFTRIYPKGNLISAMAAATSKSTKSRLKKAKGPAVLLQLERSGFMTPYGRPKFVSGEDYRSLPRELYDCLTAGAVRYDLTACNPTIVLHLLLGGNPSSQLAEYVADRRAFCDDRGLPHEPTKEVVNRMVTCPSSDVGDVDHGPEIKEQLTQLQFEFTQAHSTLRNSYPEFYQSVGKTGGSAMTFFCQDVETAAMAAAVGCIPTGVGLEVKHDQLDAFLPPTTNLADLKHSMECAMLRLTGVPFKMKCSVVESKLPTAMDIDADYEDWKDVFEQTNFFVRAGTHFGSIDPDTGVLSYRSEPAFKLLYKPYNTLVTRWIGDKTRREVSQVVFAPPPMTVPPNSFNLWDMKNFAAADLPPIGPEEDAASLIEPVLAHVKNLCGGEGSVEDWFVSYLAHIIQRPGEKVAQTAFMFGLQGNGKGSLIYDFFIVQVLGQPLAVKYSTMTEWFRQFNPESEGTLLIYVEETKRADFDANYVNLKAFTGADTRLVERKGKDRYTSNNLCRTMISANDSNAMKIQHSDRRIGVQCAGIMPKDPLQHFNSFHAAIRNPRVARAFYEYLLDYTINVDFRVPVADSILAKASRSFNYASSDQGKTAEFLACYIEFSMRFWAKRDGKDTPVGSTKLKVPLPAMNAAWKTFMDKYYPQSKLRLESELDKLNVSEAVLGDGGKRENLLDISANPTFRWGGKSCARFVRLDTGRMEEVLAKIIGDHAIADMIRECDHMFEEEALTYVSKNSGK